VHISITDARQLAETFLAKGGIVPTDAAIIADVLLEAELRGRKTHGFIRLTGIKSRYNPTSRQKLRFTHFCDRPNKFCAVDTVQSRSRYPHCACQRESARSRGYRNPDPRRTGVPSKGGTPRERYPFREHTRESINVLGCVGEVISSVNNLTEPQGIVKRG